tara:strand:+ start:329 stop:526 length:198 start_codon:yes stop_codon:yes gene_type:complete
MKTRSGKVYSLNNKIENKDQKLKLNQNIRCREILGFIIDILIITVILNILFLTLYLTKLSVRGKY